MGFRPDLGRQAFEHEYATLARHYIKWNEIENAEDDGIDRIRAFCNEKWKGVEAANIKVIPRVYLHWSKDNQKYWPADMKADDYSSEQFNRRVRRLVARLGECWDNDPRVAFIQMGLIGKWGEHHSPDVSPEMQKLYEVAADYHVPILLHWQHGMYYYGFERFYKMLEKYPRTTFIGHAQTWWANIDKNHNDQAVLYPKGKVTPGGLTDRYLSDYPNMYGDLSAGSGLNAFTRDEDHAREFIQRHQDKLLYGSDCNDLVGQGAKCSGAQMIAAIRRLSPSKDIERKLLYQNAKGVFRI